MYLRQKADRNERNNKNKRIKEDIRVGPVLAEVNYLQNELLDYVARMIKEAQVIAIFVQCFLIFRVRPNRMRLLNAQLLSPKLLDLW